MRRSSMLLACQNNFKNRVESTRGTAEARERAVIIGKTHGRHKSVRWNSVRLSFREFSKTPPGLQKFGRKARSRSSPGEGVRSPWGGYIFRYLIQRATALGFMNYRRGRARKFSLGTVCTSDALAGCSPLRLFARRHIAVRTNERAAAAAC